jgi:hypothetical protein
VAQAILTSSVHRACHRDLVSAAVGQRHQWPGPAHLPVMAAELLQPFQRRGGGFNADGVQCRPPRRTSWAAMTLRWISLVPSPTIISGASRK